jgi:hypothetical protein
LRFFNHKLLPAILREPVALKLPVAGAVSHLRNDPTPPPQPVERRVQRTVLHLQEVVGRALNMLSYMVRVRRHVEKRAQNEQVQRALK